MDQQNWTSICPPLKTYFLHVQRNVHYDNYLLAVFTVNILSSIAATFSNFVVIVTFLKTASLQTPSNLLIFGLAISDFGAGVLVIPAFCLYKFSEFKRDVDYYCHSGFVFSSGITAFGTTSFLTLTVITADRFLAVHLHLRYKEFVTTNRYIITLIFIWCICIVCISFRLPFYNQDIVIVSTILMVLMVILNAFFIFKISRVIHKHSVQIQAQEQSVQQNITVDLPRYKKSVNTMYYVIGAFMMCYVPFAIVMIWISIDKYFSFEKRCIVTIGETLLLLNSALNPVIYCWRIQEIRAASWHLLRGVWTQSESPTV